MQHFKVLTTVVVVCLLTSCSSGKKPPVCFPVHGSVASKGRPLADAMVVLHRIGGDVEGSQKPMAFTDATGTFTLTTHTHNDGAPTGEYAITVELRALTTGGEEPVRNGPNTLPAKYAKPQTSGFKYTVVDGDNQIPPIDVK